LFLELKALGKKPTALQLREMERINNASNTTTKATWADSFDEAVWWIESICLP